MKLSLAVLTVGIVSAVAIAEKKVESKPADAFYVYREKAAKENHYVPAGWMGDYSDLKFNDAYKADCADGNTCIEIKYSGEAKQGANWAGIYWTHPAMNWGDKPGGFDLTGYKKLTFWARGAKGGEQISEFKVGGISGEHGDSDAVSVGPVTLTNQWKKYELSVKDANLSQIIAGFCWAASKDYNPDGFTFYLDEIRFER